MPQENASKGGKRPLRIGKYEVIAHIATGGMGAVYKAVDTDLQRPVALKILSAEMAAKPNVLERFKREGRSAAKLHHENIVAIHECGEFSGTHFLALEFVDGMDLHDHITGRGQLGVDEALRIMIQAAKALDHAHRNNIIHRDIKPSNFLITKDEQGELLVKLTDLGLARHVSDDEFRVTKADTTIGTVDYMSPEQAQNSGSADIRSDIYSLGCTYYHMLAGKCPFPTGSLVDRLLKHREADAPDIRTLNNSVPAAMAKILRRMLAKKPEDRYQRPWDLLQDLEKLSRVPVSLTDRGPRLVPLEPRADKTTAKKRPESTPAAGRKEVPPTEEVARRDKTKEYPRAEKSAEGKKKRSRDQLKDKSKRAKTRLPAWWPWVAGWGVVLLVVVILWPLLLGDKRAANDASQAKTELARVPADGTRKGEVPPVKQPGQAFIGPEEPPLPRLYQPSQPLDRAELRKEFLGPFQNVSVPPADAEVVKVKRLPGPGEYRTVGEALAKTSGPLVVEIHDQGPIFEPSMPPVRQRSLWIRAGAGFRPLLAWDMAGDPKKASSPFLALAAGRLTLEGIDVVAKWPAGGGAEPGCLFALRAGHFEALNCTFSVAGRDPRGLALVRIEKSGPEATAVLGTAQIDPGPAEATPAQVQFRRCYVRGPDLVVLDGKGAPLEALVDESLLVVGNQSMFRIASREEDRVTLRFVRSTLVCGQNCVRWNSLGGKPGSPHIQVLAWDALMARADAGTPQGDLFSLADGADLVNVKWRPVNSLYAGWKRLIHSADKTVAAGAFDAWRALWSIREGDQELGEVWPPHLPTEPETLAPQLFATYETAAAFAASGGPGALGCDLGRLAPEPLQAWQRTFDRSPMPSVTWPDSDVVPAIPALTAGLYQGEHIDLTKTDLGKHLQSRLQAARPGPRIVLHLTGKGKQYTSPIHVQGVPNLVLFFEPAKAKDEPLTLLLHPQAGQERRALIEVQDGNLELINARCLLENKKTGPVPAYLIRLRGGDLILNGCHLQGALDKAPDAYQGLIRFEGSETDEGTLPGVSIKDSVLLSARSLLDLSGPARVRMKNCAALAVDDGLVFTAGSPAAFNLLVQLEHNTLAFRKDLVTVHADGNVAENSKQIVVQAQRNYLLNPFVDEPRQATLLRIAGATFAQGIFQWQGKGNAYDHSRLAYFAGAEDDRRKQAFKDWQQLWGSPGEQDATLLEPGKVGKAFTVDPPSWPHLGVPPQVRAVTGTPAFGADLVRLELLKRKA